MTSMLADMLNSSLAKFASQLKSSSGGKGDSESTQNVPSDHEKDPSDHDEHSEGRDLASVEELSEAPGDSQFENLMMTEEEQRDFETFTLASPYAHRGKTSWKASQENMKFYSQAQQARHQSESLASQASSLGSVDQDHSQAQPLLVQAQAPAQVHLQDQFPVLLPHGHVGHFQFWLTVATWIPFSRMRISL